MRKRGDDPGQPGDVSRMDDFEVIAQWRRTAAALTALTERYQALNYEIGTRETLKWMMAP